MITTFIILSVVVVLTFMFGRNFNDWNEDFPALIIYVTLISAFSVVVIKTFAETSMSGPVVVKSIESHSDELVILHLTNTDQFTENFTCVRNKKDDYDVGDTLWLH